MKKSICILLAMILIILPSGTISVSAQGNTDIGDKIESFVDKHKDTTAGMMVSVFDENGIDKIAAPMAIILS